jgi:hypothetical protein
MAKNDLVYELTEIDTAIKYDGIGAFALEGPEAGISEAMEKRESHASACLSLFLLWTLG